MKRVTGILVFIFVFLLSTSQVDAGWVNGYYRSNGTYVSGYYKTDPDVYKWNNYSFDDDWSDSYNDNTYYRSYGYDPEPYDDDYVSSYSKNSYWDNSYDYDYDYDYDYNYDYNYYDDYSYDSTYDSDWSWSDWDW